MTVLPLAGASTRLSSASRQEAGVRQEFADLGLVQLAGKPCAQRRGSGQVKLFAVAQPARGDQERTDVVGGVEDLGYAALDVQQLVDGLHRGAHGVLGGEDAVAGGLG